MEDSVTVSNMPFMAKLTGSSNYNNWKFWMEMWLKDLGVWGAIAGYPEGDFTSVVEKN